jgi:lantibiotic modifying enzyme
MGRVTFLDLLARNRNDAQAAAARDAGVHSLLRQPVDAWRMIDGVSDTVMVPGFFSGVAGVGYELLRMYIDPSLPCVLTWEG